jgi:hypothetical protein
MGFATETNRPTDMTLQDKLAAVIAYALPNRVIYWAAIRLIVHATTGQYGYTAVSELSAREALKRWNDSSFRRNALPE